MLRGEAAVRPASRYFRIYVHLAALLTLWMSLAQAAHHHGSWTEGPAAYASLHSIDSGAANSSELNCPLCMVGQTTLPAFAMPIERLSACTEPLCSRFDPAEPRGFWSYYLFSRPPPSFESLAV